VRRLRILIPAAGVVAASVGGACAWLLLSADRAVAVTVPRVDARTAQVCAALAKHLPATVEGQNRDRTSPDSPLAAAWGKHPIVLTCGVGTPAELDPEAEAVYANGVAWLPVQQSDGWEFYAIQRAVYIEVSVPSAYNLGDGNPGMDAATDLSAAVIAGTPTDQGTTGPDVNPD